MKSIVCFAVLFVFATISTAQDNQETGKCPALETKFTTYLEECRTEISEIQVQQNDSVSEIDVVVVEEEEAGQNKSATTSESPEFENGGNRKRSRQEAANAVTKKYPIAVCIISKLDAVSEDKINYDAIIQSINSESIEEEVKEKITKKLGKCSEESCEPQSKKHKNMPLLRDIICISKAVIKPCGKESIGFEALEDFVKLKKMGFGKEDGKGKRKGKKKNY